MRLPTPRVQPPALNGLRLSSLGDGRLMRPGHAAGQTRPPPLKSLTFYARHLPHAILLNPNLYRNCPLSRQLRELHLTDQLQHRLLLLQPLPRRRPHFTALDPPLLHGRPLSRTRSRVTLVLSMHRRHLLPRGLQPKSRLPAPLRCDWHSTWTSHTHHLPMRPPPAAARAPALSHLLNSSTLSSPLEPSLSMTPCPAAPPLNRPIALTRLPSRTNTRKQSKRSNAAASTAIAHNHPASYKLLAEPLPDAQIKNLPAVAAKRLSHRPPAGVRHVLTCSVVAFMSLATHSVLHGQVSDSMCCPNNNFTPHIMLINT